MSKAAKPDAAEAMSKATKPGAAEAMSKTAKPGVAEETDAPPPKKSKKKLIIIIAVMVLLIGGGAAAFLLKKPAHPVNPDEAGGVVEESHPEVPPAYVQLGTFTANLIHEEGDRYLQIAIELKVAKPELAEKIKATNPEILHHINMLLQSKRPSELATFEGKQKLAEQIKAQVEYVLGWRKTPPVVTESDTASNTAQSSPAEAPAGQSGIADVLFTSFIIQ